jgi:hypothetical protein
MRGARQRGAEPRHGETPAHDGEEAEERFSLPDEEEARFGQRTAHRSEGQEEIRPIKWVRLSRPVKEITPARNDTLRFLGWKEPSIEAGLGPCFAILARRGAHDGNHRKQSPHLGTAREASPNPSPLRTADVIAGSRPKERERDGKGECSLAGRRLCASTRAGSARVHARRRPLSGSETRARPA